MLAVPFLISRRTPTHFLLLPFEEAPARRSAATGALTGRILALDRRRTPFARSLPRVILALGHRQTSRAGSALGVAAEQVFRLVCLDEGSLHLVSQLLAVLPTLH